MKTKYKVGQSLWATEPYIMKNGKNAGKPALIVGKEYKIDYIYDDEEDSAGFSIIDESGSNHSFDLDDINKRYFSDRPPASSFLTDGQGEAELLRCPFCGGEPELIQNGRNSWKIKCKNCVHGRTQKTHRSLEWLREQMIKRWNQRTSALTPVEVVEAQSSQQGEVVRELLNVQSYLNIDEPAFHKLTQLIQKLKG